MGKGGGSPSPRDWHHPSPCPHRQAAQHELAERLVECQYELTDRLAFYLCGRKPGECRARRRGSALVGWGVKRGGCSHHPCLCADHKNGHYIIPQMADR